MKRRSQIFAGAIKLLRRQELEISYREANSEIDRDWDAAISDGLSDETWDEIHFAALNSSVGARIKPPPSS